MGGRGLVGIIVMLTAAVAVGCAGAQPEAAPPPTARAATPGVELAAPAVTAYVGPPRGAGKMPGVRPTRMAAALAQAGLSVADLPPLQTLAPGPRQRVMRTFTEALGVPCVGCHAENSFKADTRRKRVARRMWDDLVRVFQTKDGAPVYCDSCHDGALFHLDRHEPAETAAYMSRFMVGALRRNDGRTHDCTTCHGDPPDFTLLATWKASVAPEIVASGDDAISPTWPLETPRRPVDCGPKAEDCPLDAFMRLVVAPAAARPESREQLAAILERTATYAPDLPSFAENARRAAAAARTGSRADLLRACGACHENYKGPWRAERRGSAPR